MKINGIGYIGKPIFAKGLNKIKIDTGFGLFPGWRIEVLAGSVEIGKNVRIGNNFFLNCGSHVLIADEVTISANVFIGTTDYKINNGSFKEWEVIEKPVIIAKGCFIGFGAVILPGTILEDGCVVGANSVVKGKYEKNSVIAGVPAKVIYIKNDE